MRSCQRAASWRCATHSKRGLWAGARFISTIVVTRLLLPEQLGLFAIAVTISGFLWMLSTGMGLAGALIGARLRPSLLTFGRLLLSNSPHDHPGRRRRACDAALRTCWTTLTAVMVAAAPITAFRGAGAIVLERQLLYRRLATAETVEMMVYSAWTIVTVAIGWGVWGLATATVVRSLVGTALIVALAPIGVVWPRYYPPTHSRNTRYRCARAGRRLRDGIARSDPSPGYGSCRKCLHVSPTGASLFERSRRPGCSCGRCAHLLSCDGQDQVCRRRSRQHVATAPVSLDDSHRHAARAHRRRRTSPCAVSVWREVSPAADALSLAALAVVIHTPVLIAGQSFL